MFNDNNLGALILPGFPCPAPNPEELHSIYPYIDHLFFGNYVNLPCGVLPIRLSNE